MVRRILELQRDGIEKNEQQLVSWINELSSKILILL